MSEAALLTLVSIVAAQAAALITAWIKTQKDITEVKTDIQWLKRHAEQRREDSHG